MADVECRVEDAGQHQVRASMAWVFDRYAQSYNHLYALQNAARRERLGLWADPEPVPPRDWRAAKRAQ
ncbi:thermonuclease family protein [Schlegelella sp. S2-27]|uniref:Thermonuclease family protein n=1 Tax=Caldimonas mangrovi TaxID=2944811 RepID=A0ABT0YX26_9BURK|nr:thermonuclease family protein [Caldimonas mangrovi]